MFVSRVTTASNILTFQKLVLAFPATCNSYIYGVQNAHNNEIWRVDKVRSTAVRRATIWTNTEVGHGSVAGQDSCRQWFFMYFCYFICLLLFYLIVCLFCSGTVVVREQTPPASPAVHSAPEPLRSVTADSERCTAILNTCFSLSLSLSLSLSPVC